MSSWPLRTVVGIGRRPSRETRVIGAGGGVPCAWSSASTRRGMQIPRAAVLRTCLMFAQACRAEARCNNARQPGRFALHVVVDIAPDVFHVAVDVEVLVRSGQVLAAGEVVIQSEGRARGSRASRRRSDGVDAGSTR